jgi:hypothetical protein
MPGTHKLMPAPKRSQRHASWMTPHGRVDTSFWTVSDTSRISDAEENTSTATDREFGAKVAIVPSYSRTSRFRVVFDITPHLGPKPKITYQAMIPNDSEIFNLIKFGKVEEFIEALERGTASLTDRDEQGRSLLHVSYREASL